MIQRSLSLDCSPEVVFSAFTDAAEIVSWWGDDLSYRTVEWQAEPHRGGRWRALFATPGGQSFSAGGEYGAVHAPSVLEWTWSADWDPGSVKHISMKFERVSGGTNLHITSEGHQSDDERTADERGWDQILGWLRRHYNISEHV